MSFMLVWLVNIRSELPDFICLRTVMMLTTHPLTLDISNSIVDRMSTELSEKKYFFLDINEVKYVLTFIC